VLIAGNWQNISALAKKKFDQEPFDTILLGSKITQGERNGGIIACKALLQKTNFN